MIEQLNIGLIQPVINPDSSWGTKQPYTINIDSITAERVWQEIKTGVSLLLKESNKPDVILIPELHLPPNKVNLLKSIATKNNTLIIAGIDFQTNSIDAKKIRNQGVAFIPYGWGTGLKANRSKTHYFGKTYFTYMERSMFHHMKWKEDPEQNMYIFNSKKYGDFGIIICSDIFDIERMLLYQTRIHHLFIISLNKDLTTYFHLGETLARLLYCNVVVCNTGYFGGSLVISPYDDQNSRLIYKYQGQKMFNTHLVQIPVLAIDKAQNFDFSREDKEKNGIKFKASPPGYFDKRKKLSTLSNLTQINVDKIK